MKRYRAAFILLEVLVAGALFLLGCIFFTRLFGLSLTIQRNTLKRMKKTTEGITQQRRRSTKQNDGFTLLEVVVYCALFSLLVFSVLRFVNITFRDSYDLHHYYQQKMQHTLALDVLRRDIWHAGYKKQDWDFVQGVMRTYRLTKTKEIRIKDVGWLVKKNKLFRQEGEYDFLNHRWKKKSARVVARAFKNFSLQLLYKKNYIFGVNVVYSTQGIKNVLEDGSEKRYLKNGII